MQTFILCEYLYYAYANFVYKHGEKPKKSNMAGQNKHADVFNLHCYFTMNVNELAQWEYPWAILAIAVYVMTIRSTTTISDE